MSQGAMADTFMCRRCTREVDVEEGGIDEFPDLCADCWRLATLEKEPDPPPVPHGDSAGAGS
jgi:hypothetical protein